MHSASIRENNGKREGRTRLNRVFSLLGTVQIELELQCPQGPVLLKNISLTTSMHCISVRWPSPIWKTLWSTIFFPLNKSACVCIRLLWYPIKFWPFNCAAITTHPCSAEWFSLDYWWRSFIFWSNRTRIPCMASRITNVIGLFDGISSICSNGC